MSSLKLTYSVNRSISTRTKVLIPSKNETVESDSTLFKQEVQVIGTAAENLSLGDLTDDVVAVMVNNHATAIVQVGIDDASVFKPFMEIPPGRSAVIPRLYAAATTQLLSDTASTEVEILLFKEV